MNYRMLDPINQLRWQRQFDNNGSNNEQFHMPSIQGIRTINLTPTNFSGGYDLGLRSH